MINMANTITTMDTHAVINTLQKEYKVSAKTAEAMVYAVQQGQEGSEMVTKAELKAQLAKLTDTLTMRIVFVCGLFATLIIGAMSLIIAVLLGSL